MERQDKAVNKRLPLICILILCISFLSGCSNPEDIAKNTDPKPDKQEEKQVQPIPGESKGDKKDESKVNPASQNNHEAESNKLWQWYYVPNSQHQVPRVNEQLPFNLGKYKAYYAAKDQSVIYLTFDEGYENGYTAAILDVLKEKGVHASFFVTEPYIRSNPDLVRRMAAEGHLVGNHSKTHPSMPSKVNDPSAFARELQATADSYKEITGLDMPLFFRPPMGEYSEKSLSMTAELGYSTIFWSFAYQDWNIDKQPDPKAACDKIMTQAHPGEIMLLHAVSQTNSAILGSIIDGLQAQGYSFETLDALQ